MLNFYSLQVLYWLTTTQPLTYIIAPVNTIIAQPWVLLHCLCSLSDVTEVLHGSGVLTTTPGLGCGAAAGISDQVLSTRERSAGLLDYPAEGEVASFCQHPRCWGYYRV